MQVGCDDLGGYWIQNQFTYIYICICICVCICIYIYIRICKTCLKCNRSASSQSDRTSRPIITISLISSPHDLPVHSSSSTIHYSFPRIHNHVRDLYMSLGFKRRIPYQDSPGDETFHFRAKNNSLRVLAFRHISSTFTCRTCHSVTSW